MQLRRIALVIGNGTYTEDDFSQLPNAVSDAVQVAKCLKDRGFEIDLRIDLDAKDMTAAINQFRANIEAVPSYAVFYYAGHGCEQNGLTYFYPTDMPGASLPLIPRYGISITEVLGQPHPGAPPRILILDCCRTSGESWSADERTRFEELVAMARHRNASIHSNTLIAYSTSSGEIALDGLGVGSNGPYCTELCPLLLEHRLTVEDVFKEVGMKVSRISNGRQRPWFYSNLSSDLTFSDIPNVVATGSIETPLRDSIKGLIKDPHRDGVIVYCDGSSEAHCIDGIAGLGNYSFNEKVELMARWRDGLIIYDHKGWLWKQLEENRYHSMKISIDKPLFLISSPDGNLVIFGGISSFHVIDIPRQRVQEIERLSASWYAGLFLSESRAWITGSSGALLEIEFQQDEIVIQDIDLSTHEMLYTICRVDDLHVIISASSGRVYKVSISDHKVVWKRELGATVRTPAARMQSILNTATDNEIIRRFLFEPESLTEEQGKILSNKLSSNDLLFSASTTSSIFVVGSNEGLLYLLDCRDGRQIEVIDNAAGRCINIEGVCFLDDERFAVLDQLGTVRLYSLARVPYRSALRYVDNLGWSNNGRDLG